MRRGNGLLERKGIDSGSQVVGNIEVGNIEKDSAVNKAFSSFLLKPCQLQGLIYLGSASLDQLQNCHRSSCESFSSWPKSLDFDLGGFVSDDFRGSPGRYHFVRMQQKG